MIKIVTELMLVISLILTLIEYRKTYKQNEEVIEILEEMRTVRKKLRDECKDLFDLTNRSLIESQRAAIISGSIIEKYDICIDKYSQYKDELSKYRAIIDRSKKIRVKRKTAKRIIRIKGDKHE
ncbi:hypothetical protein [Clostridium butyricum]|uniref:hypothetical protein n=1 Tax=Clostridium butyricum TaxID=1492 RepID=UPI0005C1D20B|nr:hypothetical protein [Clostridium butyricum]KIU07877.1 hypothetical protein SC08_Contig83orf01806 [Clostridium butyricum]MBA8967704.1 hypothetical protein [Clostridium butyricum]MBA8971228.1 hypothetical protein [Clostridium butyricum]MBC2427551.1 hypothetical protein [Clostridium butyricum]NOW36905.1 hypothetical protein [Clostridium butyricum]